MYVVVQGPFSCLLSVYAILVVTSEINLRKAKRKPGLLAAALSSFTFGFSSSDTSLTNVNYLLIDVC